MKRSITLAAVLAAVLGSGSAWATQPPSAKMLSLNCASCHGYEGVSVGPATPSIAGMSEEYFIMTMLDYKDGRRPATVMDRIAAGYTEQEIEIMASYFASLQYRPAPQPFDEVKARRGAEVHEQSCSRCHSENATVAEDDSMILAGQWKPYLAFSIEDFNAHDRAQPRRMRRGMVELSDEDVEALLHFYASQQHHERFMGQ
ncbi:cytochrome c subunit of flavocytochrome c sulfide dehydrogenase [Thioalkalivibrio denitrificans]|uniref:Cytochrome c subunit of flavocytochrome c sulfide dehydrogenase n=1 Tax=Thioalkalivibrio denitrificans TaxID=108003 RepID=A0A1V3NCH5_9GAMM|nr:c-type cytochrome [Thioalkalivibrio denitrificans]OOG22476.1 cytochrome c subunit of flavocytochrome c sulfide dehydrogenase [Thioalkalivibrio denitrificans]